MIINPDIREAHMLKGWYENEGYQKDFTGFRSEGGGGGGGGEFVFEPRQEKHGLYDFQASPTQSGLYSH